MENLNSIKVEKRFQKIWEQYKDHHKTEGYELTHIFDIYLPFWQCKQNIVIEKEVELDRFSRIILELINWFFIDKLNLPPFIVTIGSQSLYKGFLLAFVGTTYITTMPKGMRKLAVTYVSSTTSSSGIVYNLHFLVIVVAAMYIIMHIVLNFTRFGRNIYAIGADVAAAQRAGINISRTRFLVFLIAGAIAGVGGVFQGTLNRAAVPADLVGQELLVIAAVVLGGGGGKQARGSVLGTALGVILLSLISNNLILMKVPSYWQQAVTGIIILIGLIIQSTEAISKL